MGWKRAMSVRALGSKANSRQREGTRSNCYNLGTNDLFMNKRLNAGLRTCLSENKLSWPVRTKWRSRCSERPNSQN